MRKSNSLRLHSTPHNHSEETQTGRTKEHENYSRSHNTPHNDNHTGLRRDPETCYDAHRKDTRKCQDTAHVMHDRDTPPSTHDDNPPEAEVKDKSKDTNRSDTHKDHPQAALANLHAHNNIHSSHDANTRRYQTPSHTPYGNRQTSKQSLRPGRSVSGDIR